MRKLIRLSSILLTPLMVLGLQVGTFSVAHALGNADLAIYTNTSFSNSAIQTQICNSGTDDVTQFTFSQTPTNMTITETYIAIPLSDISDGSDIGSFNDGSNTWTGNLVQNDCITFLSAVTITSSLGSTVSIDSSIVSSELSGPVANVDPNSSNDSTTLSFTNVPKSNLNVSTRLKTTGAITPSSNITYEATLTNVGPGDYVDNGFMILAFVMPEDSTFISATNVTTGAPTSCIPIGPITSLGFQALQTFDYAGDVVACFLTGAFELPSGESNKFDIELTAGATFAAGNAEVIVVIEGNDVDTLSIFRALSLNTDPLADNTGNFVYLSYDPAELNATSTLCPGQPAVSTDGTGCFRISFNKPIYEESFGVEDITVSGSGTVDTLTKIGDNLWELRIKNIKAGQTATISLNTGGIVDYSAIESNTRVLGINAIRYEQATLPQTGVNSSDLATPFMLLLIGIALSISSRKKNIVSVRTIKL